jgi:hypothetical protein
MKEFAGEYLLAGEDLLEGRDSYPGITLAMPKASESNAPLGPDHRC